MTGLHLPPTFRGPAWFSRASVLSIHSRISALADRPLSPSTFWLDQIALRLTCGCRRHLGSGPSAKELRERNRAGVVGQAVPSAELVVAPAAVGVEADA